MNNKKLVPFLVWAVVLLSVCFALSVGYILGTSTERLNQEKKTSNNSNLGIDNANLEVLTTKYNTQIIEKSEAYLELEKEKTRVMELLGELDNSKENEFVLLKYKEQYKNLESKMHQLEKEIKTLKEDDKSVIVSKNNKKSNFKSYTSPEIKEQTSVITNDNKNQKVIFPPKNKGEVLKKEILEDLDKEKVITEFKIVNLNVLSFSNKSTDKYEITTTANKVDLLKISFTVDVTSNEALTEKKFYIQVIDSKNNILGKKITEFFDEKTLTYSISKTVQFQKNDVEVNLEISADKFEKGSYTVNVFDRSKLVAKTIFEFK